MRYCIVYTFQMYIKKHLRNLFTFTFRQLAESGNLLSLGWKKSNLFFKKKNIYIFFNLVYLWIEVFSNTPPKTRLNIKSFCLKNDICTGKKLMIFFHCLISLLKIFENTKTHDFKSHPIHRHLDPLSHSFVLRSSKSNQRVSEMALHLQRLREPLLPPI